MVETLSTMIPLETAAPEFHLQDTITGEWMSLDQLKSETATVVMFICNHCPFVKHVQKQLVLLAKDFQDKSVSFVAISSNDVKNYPDDSPERMKEVALRLGYPFPYLFDETQDVAKAYNAVCTPDFFVFDAELKLVYRGQLDDSRPSNNIPVTGKDIRNALQNLLEGKSINPEQRPSIGCNIKWKED